MYKHLLQHSFENKTKIKLFTVNKFHTSTSNYNNDGNPENNNNNKKTNLIIAIILGFYFIHLKK
jgi:hypothetical protein